MDAVLSKRRSNEILIFNDTDEIRGMSSKYAFDFLLRRRDFTFVVKT